MTKNLTGVDDVLKNLKKMQKSAEEIEGTNTIPFTELFNNSFMQANTKFSDIENFEKESKFDFSEMDSIDEKKLDEFVNLNTKFDSWDSMMTSASNKWVTKKLGL